MEIKVIRRWFDDKSTIGEMYIDGIFECFTLEDKYRLPEEPKVPKETAIPEGEFVVIIDMSTRFKKLMPHILDVPNFEGVRIHTGNTDQDVEGCIIIGRTHDKDLIGESRLAFAAFWIELNKAIADKEKVTIKIINEKV